MSVEPAASMPAMTSMPVAGWLVPTRPRTVPVGALATDSKKPASSVNDTLTLILWP